MKRLIATALAASLVLTSVAVTPARAADSGEIGRFLLGAGTLFIIGSALSNSDRRYNDNSRVVTRRHVDRDYRHQGRDRDFHRNGRHQGRSHASALPRQCLLRNRHGHGKVYSARCLRRFGY